jgi:hypothetical protein
MSLLRRQREIRINGSFLMSNMISFKVRLISSSMLQQGYVTRPQEIPTLEAVYHCGLGFSFLSPASVLCQSSI